MGQPLGHTQVQSSRALSAGFQAAAEPSAPPTSAAITPQPRRNMRPRTQKKFAEDSDDGNDTYGSQ